MFGSWIDRVNVEVLNTRKKGLGYFMILIDFFFPFSFSPRFFFFSFPIFFFLHTFHHSLSIVCCRAGCVCVCPYAFVCVQLLSVDPNWPAERDFGLFSRLHVTSGGVRQSGGISNGPQHDGRNPSRHDPLQELNQIDPHPPQNHPITPLSLWNGKRKKKEKYSLPKDNRSKHTQKSSATPKFKWGK